MPKFDGENVQGWIYKAKKYLRYHNIPDEERITVATINMEGEALEWLLWVDRNNSLSSWSDFLDDLVKRFGTSAYEIPAGRLSKLVQTTSVKEYQHQFEALSNKITEVTPLVLKEMFMSGLKPEIQKDVIKARPESLVEAFALAQLYEKDDMSTDIVRYCPPGTSTDLGKIANNGKAIQNYQTSKLYSSIEEAISSTTSHYSKGTNTEAETHTCRDEN